MDCSEIAKQFARDRHFCTRTVLRGLEDAGACFIVREHANHPRLAEQGAWRNCGRTETGKVREQATAVAEVQARWRRIELALDQPTEDGDTPLRLWGNLPEAVTAGRIAELYRARWRVERSRSPVIEGMFGRLERVLHSELGSLGHPRGRRCSALPLPRWNEADPAGLAQHLLRLARTINPRQAAISKRGPKAAKPKGYVDGRTARAHVAAARLLAKAKATP